MDRAVVARALYLSLLREAFIVPPKSQQQRKAMYAAASGKSTLGIPASVGREFVAADKGGKLPKRVKRK